MRASANSARGVFGGAVALVEGDEEERDQEVSGNQEGGEAGGQAEEEQDAAEELGERGDVPQPVGQAEAGDGVTEVLHAGEQVVILQTAEWYDLAPAVDDHGGAENQAHAERAEGLKTAEPANHTFLTLMSELNVALYQ